MWLTCCRMLGRSRKCQQNGRQAIWKRFPRKGISATASELGRNPVFTSGKQGLHWVDSGEDKKRCDAKLRKEQAGFRKGRSCTDQIATQVLHHHRAIARMAFTVVCPFCWLLNGILHGGQTNDLENFEALWHSPEDKYHPELLWR